MKVGLASVIIVCIALVVFLLRRPNRAPKFSEPPMSACSASYARLHQNEKLRILIAYGYKDARPRRFVGDRYERNAFIDRLTSPCAKGETTCGFNRDEANADAFSKTLNKRHVEIILTDSSMGPDDDLNQKNARQIKKSIRATEFFLSAPKHFDVIFYSGHSRDGGGPDFFPPRQRRDKSVDYAFYRRNRPGMKALLEALGRDKPRAQVLGLFSCASSKHFDDEIRKRAPSLSTITTPNLLFYSDAQDQMARTLETILSEKCPDSGLRSRWRRFF